MSCRHGALAMGMEQSKCEGHLCAASKPCCDEVARRAAPRTEDALPRLMANALEDLDGGIAKLQHAIEEGEEVSNRHYAHMSHAHIRTVR